MASPMSTPNDNNDNDNNNKTTALSYLDQVKEAYAHDRPAVYREFLRILTLFRSRQIDSPGVIRRIHDLLKQQDMAATTEATTATTTTNMRKNKNISLLFGLEQFLPAGCSIYLPPDDPTAKPVVRYYQGCGASGSGSGNANDDDDDDDNNDDNDNTDKWIIVQESAESLAVDCRPENKNKTTTAAAAAAAAAADDDDGVVDNDDDDSAARDTPNEIVKTSCNKRKSPPSSKKKKPSLPLSSEQQQQQQHQQHEDEEDSSSSPKTLPTTTSKKRKALAFGPRPHPPPHSAATIIIHRDHLGPPPVVLPKLLQNVSPLDRKRHLQFLQQIFDKDDNDNDKKEDDNDEKETQQIPTVKLCVQVNPVVHNNGQGNTGNDKEDDADDDVDSFDQDLQHLQHNSDTASSSNKHKKRQRGDRHRMAKTTLQQLEQQTVAWHRSATAGNVEDSSYRPFSLLFNECSLTAITQWASVIPPPTTTTSAAAVAAAAAVPASPRSQLINVFARRAAPGASLQRIHYVVDPQFRKCSLCQLWGHYENECSKYNQENDNKKAFSVPPFCSIRTATATTAAAAAAGDDNDDNMAFLQGTTTPPDATEPTVVVETCGDFLIEQRATTHLDEYEYQVDRTTRSSHYNRHDHYHHDHHHSSHTDNNSQPNDDNNNFIPASTTIIDGIAIHAMRRSTSSQNSTHSIE